MGTTKLYEPPVVNIEPIDGFLILSESDPKENIILPYNSGQSTSEALSNDNGGIWDTGTGLWDEE